MDFWQIIIALINIIIWPLVILIIAYWLKDPIKEILARVRGLKYGDASVDLEQKGEQKLINPKNFSEGPNKDIDSITEEYNKKYSNTTMQQIERGVKEMIKFEAESTPEKKIKDLLSYSKIASLTALFLRIYQVIFGSQIKLLMKLNSFNELTYDELKDFYDEAKRIWPALYNTYSYDSYLGYLIGTQLISRSNERFSITDWGKDFLRFLIEEKQMPDKLY